MVVVVIYWFVRYLILKLAAVERLIIIRIYIILCLKKYVWGNGSKAFWDEDILRFFRWVRVDLCVGLKLANQTPP